MLIRKFMLATSTTLLMCSAAMADDYIESQTVSLGYQQGRIKDFGKIQGGNFRFQYETATPWGFMGSLTAMKNNWQDVYSSCKKGDNKCVEKYKEKHKLDRKAEYYSFMAGPTYRLTDNLSLFALGGMSHTKVDKALAYNPLDMSYNKNGSDSSNQFAYSAGLTFNPTRNLALTAGFEGSRAAFDSKKHTMSSVFLNAGYRF